MSVRRLRDVTDVANKYKVKVKPLFYWRCVTAGKCWIKVKQK